MNSLKYMRTILSLAAICFVNILSFGQQPNIILLFADDLGYGDLSCFGHPYALTPNLDQLAQEGTMFMKFNVTGKTCHPSRCGLLTSRTPSSYPIPTVDYGFNQAQHGFQDRRTIMEYMKGAGYATGHIGKWHIGPEREIKEGIYGIDKYVLLGGGGKDSLGRDMEIYDEAIKFIEDNKDKPFYLNVMGRVTHSPVAPRNDLIQMAGFGTIDENGDLLVEEFVDRLDFQGTQIQENFDIVESANNPENIAVAQDAGIIGDINYSMANYLTEVYFLDQFIGKLLSRLDELGIADNTIVMFASDQGPAPVQFDTKKPEKINLIGYSGGLRGQKHDEYEGGVRVPCIVRWPGNIPAGKVNTESTWSALDWLPTLCGIAGIELVDDDLHGEDVSDIWMGSDRSRTNPQFWTSALKVIDDDGEWRMYFENATNPTAVELYNLSTDIGETENLLTSHLEKASELTLKWLKWQKYYHYDSIYTHQSGTFAKELETKKMRVFPNPASDYLHIETAANKKNHISIYNMQGQLVLRKTTGRERIDISGIASGEYIVQVSNRNHILHQQKLVIQ
jgi:N-acetylgalactosamine-6-sulfatase